MVLWVLFFFLNSTVLFAQQYGNCIDVILRLYDPTKYPELTKNFYSESFRSEREALEWLISNFPDSRLNLSEKETLRKHLNSVELNTFLRGTPFSRARELNAFASDLDNIIAKTALNKDIVVYRVVRKNLLNLNDFAQPHTFKDPTFVSTSLTFPTNVSEDYAIFKYNVPKGTKVSNAQPFEDPIYGLGSEREVVRTEMEIILARDQMYRATGYTEVNRRQVIEINLIP